jgi:hypothetical protein
LSLKVVDKRGSDEGKDQVGLPEAVCPYTFRLDCPGELTVLFPKIRDNIQGVKTFKIPMRLWKAQDYNPKTANPYQQKQIAGLRKLLRKIGDECDQLLATMHSQAKSARGKVM